MSDAPQTPRDAARAKRYSRIRLALYGAGLAQSALELTWFALSGRAARLRRQTAMAVPDRRLTTPTFVAACGALGWLSQLPRSYLGGHLIERRFGLTKQTTGGWAVDELKGLGLGLALQTALISGAYAVIRRRPGDWWLVLSGATVPVAVVFGALAPVVIMPLFNKFDPLRDQALATRIKDLAARAGVPIADVFEMDMSRQTEKPNAFFAGLGQTKRIVLSDTLLRDFTPAEIEGVVAHELGHQVHGDIWRLIGLASVMGTGTAYLASRLTPALIDRTRRRSGVRDVADVASLPVFGLTLMAIGLVAQPIQLAVSRAIERQTDQFALQLTGDGPTYADAIAKLAQHHLADPDPSKFVVFFLYSHPPEAERVTMARGAGGQSA